MNTTPIRDERKPGWLWIDHAVLIEHGAALGANGIAVYVGLASYANQDHQAWPGIRGLAKRVGVGTATVQRAIAQLEALGLVQVERVESRQGDRDTNRYRLLRQNEVGCAAGDTPVPLGTHGVPLGTHGGVPLGTRNKNHSSEQEPKNKKGGEAEAFVEAYHRLCPLLPRCLGITAKRRQHILARLRERPLEQWERIFAATNASSFHTGTNDRGWRADLEWLTKNSENALKILEREAAPLPTKPRAMAAGGVPMRTWEESQRRLATPGLVR